VTRVRALAHRLLRRLWSALVAAISAVELPVFLVRHRAQLRNPVVFPLWQWSFGHTVAGLDFASRLHYPTRITVIHLPHPQSNPDATILFRHNVDPIVFRSVLPARGGNIDAPRYRILVALLGLTVGRRAEIVEQSTLYDWKPLGRRPFRVRDPRSGELVAAVDWTGYVRLLREGHGRRPSLPAGELARCRSALDAAASGFAETPFATLLLRRKTVAGPIDSQMRSAGPHENYRPAVQILLDSGYGVLGAGETEHEVFADLERYVAIDDVDAPASLLNLYALSESALFIGQQSGPHVLANACGIRCVICDALPHRLGTFDRDDPILFKPLRERSSGRELSLVELYSAPLPYAYGLANTDEIEIGSNDADAIEAAVREALTGEEQAGDAALVAAFRRLVPADMPLSVHENHPPLFVLRDLRDQLLAADGAP
jgi:putative glycosyltransferase (TIGR04372 family)